MHSKLIGKCNLAYCNLLILAFLILSATGCAQAVSPSDFSKLGEVEIAGLFSGIWHGLTVPFSFIGSLWSEEVAIYAAYNNGGWYDFGFCFGLFVLARKMLGSSSSTAESKAKGLTDIPVEGKLQALSQALQTIAEDDNVVTESTEDLPFKITQGESVAIVSFMCEQLKDGKSFEEIHEALLAIPLEPEVAAFWIVHLQKRLKGTQFVEDDRDSPYVAITSPNEVAGGTTFSLRESRIRSLRSVRKYNLGDFEAELFTDVEYGGLIHFEYLFYLFDKAGTRVAVVAANSTPGESVLSMRLYNQTSEINFGSEAMISNIDQFAAEAEKIIQPILNGLE
jgi:hypothetical protein